MIEFLKAVYLLYGTDQWRFWELPEYIRQLYLKLPTHERYSGGYCLSSYDDYGMSYHRITQKFVTDLENGVI